MCLCCVSRHLCLWPWWSAGLWAVGRSSRVSRSLLLQRADPRCSRSAVNLIGSGRCFGSYTCDLKRTEEENILSVGSFTRASSNCPLLLFFFPILKSYISIGSPFVLPWLDALQLSRYFFILHPTSVWFSVIKDTKMHCISKFTPIQIKI